MEMEVYGKSSMVAGPTTTTTVTTTANVIYLSSIIGDGGIQSSCHKCDLRCQNEHVCGNMYLCKLTGITHICDKNCNQRIVYDNYSSICRVSGQVFPLSAAEVQAVRGVRRKFEMESCSSYASSDGYGGCKRRRGGDAQFHSSPFERSICAVPPICSQIGDSMDMS